MRLTIVRGVHTTIYFVMVSAVFGVLYAGVTGAQGWWLWVALVLVGVECLVFLASGMKCPLTAIAIRYGEGKAGLADTFLPERITRHTFAVFGPLIAIGFALVIWRALNG